MANNTTNFTLRLRTQGLDEAQKQTQVIRDNLEAAARAAAQVGGGTPGVATPPAGGSPGSRRVASSRAASPTGAAGASAGIEGSDVEIYNRARGASNAAGGTARDFADISRGLGGFVRLYATLAANLYAAGAAFNFLRTSMDTANMIKGMDQLGASSGRALGSLSKQLVDATDGAISLREAMEATTKAASAGLSNKQILEIGQVAKNAAQALGLNMTDAVSRLSRGIAKLEPELLDELGIFVRIDDATEKYAKTINKTAGELTDFERRQAFATAAISQGQKKFNEIKLDANPYNKLASSLGNLAQSAGDFLNKFLAPVVKYLSESPTALAAALAFIGVTLLKTVMPAFGQYRENLKKTVDETKNRVGQIVKEQGRLAGERDEAASNRGLQQFRNANKQKLDDLKQQAALFSSTAKTNYAKFADVDPVAMSQADLAAWEKKLGRRAKALDRSNAMEANLLRIHIDEVKRLRLGADEAASKEQIKVEQRDSRWYSQMSLTRKRAQAAMREANRIDILDATNKTQQLEGPLAAWRDLNEELAKPVRKIKLIDPATGQETEQEVARLEGILGWFERGGTRIRGVFGIAAQSVISFAAAWGPAITAAVGIVVAGFEILDSWLGTNKKAMQEFSAATEGVSSALKTLEDTTEKIRTKDPLEAYNAESLTAVATAIKTVSDSIDTLIIKNQKAKDASSWWDNWIEGIKQSVGMGRTTTFAEAMVDSTLKSLNRLGSSPEAAKARQEITSILEIDYGATSDQWEEAFKRIEQDSVKLNAVNARIKILSNSIGEGAEKSRKFGETLDKATEAQKNFLDKYKVKDEFSLLGEEFINVGIELSARLKEGPEAAIESLNKIVSDPKKISLFSTQDQQLLLNYKKEIQDLQKQRAKQQQDLDTLVTAQNKAATEKAQSAGFGKIARGALSNIDSGVGRAAEILPGGSFIKSTLNLIVGIDDAKVKKQQEELDARARERAKEVQAQQAKLSETNLRIAKVAAEFSGAAENQLKRGADYVEAGIARSFAGVGNAIKNAVLGVTGDLPGAADIRYQMAKEEIDSERTLIASNLELIKSQQHLAAVTQLATATTREIEANKALEEYSKTSGKSKEELMRGRETPAVLQSALSATKNRQEAEALLDVTKKIGENALTGYRQLNEEAAAGNATVTQNFKELTDYALRLAGLQGSLAKLADKEAAETFTRQINRIKETERSEQKVLDDKKRTLEFDRQSLALKLKSGKITESEALKEEEQLSSKSKRNDLDQRELGLRSRIQELQEATKVKLLSDPEQEKTRIERINAEIKRLEEQKKAVPADEAQANEQRRIEFIEKRLQLTLKELDEQAKLAQSKREIENIEQATADKLNEIRLQTAKETGKYTDEYLNQLSYNAEIFKINEEAKRREADTTAKYQVESAKLSAQLIAEVMKSGATEEGPVSEEGQRIAARLTALQASNAAEISGIQTVAAARAKSTEEIYKAKTAQDEFNKSIEQLKGLESIFGPIAGTLADIAISLNESAKNQQKYANEQKRLQDILDTGGLSEEDRIDTVKALEKTKSKATQQELSDTAKIAGNAKKLFKEKTFAYKVLAGTEKAMHLATLAMQAKELFIKLTADKTSLASKIGTEIADTAATMHGALMRAPFYIGEIYGKTIGQLGPIAGPAVAAGLAALVMSYLGGSDKGAPSVGVSAAERQEVQGTGMMWKDGKKVETGGGVFGDPEAKSESITKSLERIRETNVEGITYANKTVKLLESIDRAIGGAAKSLYGVAGLRIGSSFGTKEGTSTSGIQGLFGSKRSTEIIDAGIRFAGSFLDIIQNKAGSLVQYETTRTTKKSSGFLGIGGSTKTSESELVKNLEPKVAAEVSKIFTNTGDLLVELGGRLGKTQEDVFASLAKVDLTGKFASLRGLKGEELEKELSSVISSILDDAAVVAFKSLEKFQKFGEGMAETVIRVLDTNQKISDSFVSMGTKTIDQLVKDTFGGTQITETITTGIQGPLDALDDVVGFGISELIRNTEMSFSSFFGLVNKTVTETITREISEAELKEKSLEITEGLAELAGGLEEFLEKQKFFVDNFLTETERLVPIRRSLTEELDKLGLGFVDTREEFKQVALALSKDVTSAGGRELYNSLLDLAPAFDKVYQETEKVKEALTELDLRNRLLDQEITILGLLGDAQGALKLKRDRELEQLRQYPGIQGKLLSANQEYINALEDEKTKKDELIKRRQGLDSTVKSLKTALDTLDKYKTSLLTGSMTVLTPEQQYQENRAKFEQLRLKATTGTDEERMQAASELQGVSDKFLESSRALFASSSTYASDFQTVLDAIGASSAVLTAQKSEAEIQIEQLTASNIKLDSIETNTKTTSDLLNEYKIIQEATELKKDAAEELRKTWESELLIATLSNKPPEITLDIQPIVSELVALKNELIKQTAASETQNQAAVAVNHQDFLDTQEELRKLRELYDTLQRQQVFAPVWEDTGG